MESLVSTPGVRGDDKRGHTPHGAAVCCVPLRRHAVTMPASAAALQAATAGEAAAAGAEDPNAGARDAELQAGARGQVHVDSDPDVSLQVRRPCALT